MISSTLQSPESRRPQSYFWSDVAQALRGKRHDHTTGSLNRSLLLLAVPMMLEMVMESLFAVIGIFWVSRLGPDAIAAVGLTESVMNLVYATAIGVSFAATATVTRRIGENDPERAAVAAAQALMLGLAISAILGLVLGFFAADILTLLGASAAAVELGSDYARIMVSANATVFMIFVSNAIFRGAGDAVFAMRTLWLANALNIVLGPCFIFGWGPFPELGVTGAAVATNIGRGAGLICQLLHLTGHSGRIRLLPRHCRPRPDVFRRLLATSGNGIAQLLIGTTSWIGLYSILAAFGSAAVAGYTIAMRIIMFVLLPAFGIANAAATLVGQNLGAGHADRAEAAVRAAARFNILLLAFVGVAAVSLSNPLVRLFTTDPLVLAYGAKALWVVSLALPVYAVGTCLAAAFNGAGDTRTPTRLNFVCLWLGQIPIAWLLAHTLALGPVGVFVAVPVSQSALALMSYVFFKRGGWKLQKI